MRNFKHSLFVLGALLAMLFPLGSQQADAEIKDAQNFSFGRIGVTYRNEVSAANAYQANFHFAFPANFPHNNQANLTVNVKKDGSFLRVGSASTNDISTHVWTPQVELGVLEEGNYVFEVKLEFPAYEDNTIPEDTNEYTKELNITVGEGGTTDPGTDPDPVKPTEVLNMVQSDFSWFEATSSTTGRLRFEIQLAEGADLGKVDHFHIWARRDSDIGAEVGNIDVPTSDNQGYLELSGLNENDKTHVFIFGKAIYKDNAGEGETKWKGIGEVTTGSAVTGTEPTAAYAAEHKFALDADGNVVLTGKINVTNPDNVAIKSLRLAAASGADRGVTDVTYDKWPHNDDIIFGETTINNPVNGDNEFTIIIPKDKIKQSDNTDLWMKWELVTVAKTTDGGFNGAWNITPSTLEPVVNPDKSIIASIESDHTLFTKTSPTTGQLSWNLTVVEGADLTGVKKFLIWATKMEMNGETIAQNEVGTDVREGVLDLTYLNQNALTPVFIHAVAVMNDDTKTSLVEKGIGEVSTKITVEETPIGEVVNSFAGNIEAAERENGEIVWKTPYTVDQWDGAYNGISGDYIQRGSENTTWAETFKYTIGNDANGHVIGSIEAVENHPFPNGFAPSIYINRTRYEMNKVDDGKYTFNTAGGTTYINGAVISFLFDLPFTGSRSQTKVLLYTIDKCEKTEKSFTLDEFTKNFMGEDANILAGKIRFWSDTKDVDVEDETCDWEHIARPCDKNDGHFWNPNFDYVISNPKTEDNVEVPITIAIEFENGTLIPSNFNPQYFVYPVDANGDLIPEGDGHKRFGPYNFNARPNVLNFYAGATQNINFDITTADEGKDKAPVLRAASNQETFANGNYKIQFYHAYTSIREGHGHSETKLVNYSVDNGHADTTGIDSVIDDDTTAPVEFYNLQGIRVINPENGIFIRRQGSKTQKVIIR